MLAYQQQQKEIQPPPTSRNTIAPNDLYNNDLNSIEDNRKNNIPKKSQPDPVSFRQAEEARRKSNVVKEIEKIKKNREQRRANQEEKRQKIQEIDTSVPAWEFANMISEFRATLDFSRITSTEAVPDLRISVCVRKRPINKKGFFF